MKKAVIVAVLFGIFLISPYAYAVEPAKPSEMPKVVEPKEFISQEVPKEVQGLLDTLGFAFQTDIKMYYSGRVSGVNDYALLYFETGHGPAQALFKLALKKDAKGNVTPGEVVSEVVAYVFVDKKVSWYQSADAKAIFEKATK